MRPTQLFPILTFILLSYTLALPAQINLVEPHFAFEPGLYTLKFGNSALKANPKLETVGY